MSFAVPRQIPARDAELLKIACDQAVDAAGGVTAVADAIHLAKSKVSDKTSLFHDEAWFSLLHAAEIEVLCGDPIIARALAGISGHDVVPKGAFNRKDPHQHLAAVITETADVSALTAQALSDGRISREEARRLRGEIAQALLALQHFDAQLNGILKEGA